MKPYLHIAAIILTQSFTNCVNGQKDSAFIPLLHDTIYFENKQSLVSHQGNDFKATIKLYDTGIYRTTLYFIDSGFIQKRVDSEAISNLTFETNFKKRKLNGNYQIKNSSGTVLLNGYYKDNYEDSIWTFYYYTGIKETQGRFIPDTTKLIDDFVTTLMHGVAEEWSPIEFHKLHKHSPPNGDWEFYDKRGYLIKRMRFDKGILKAISVGENITQ